MSWILLSATHKPFGHIAPSIEWLNDSFFMSTPDETRSSDVLHRSRWFVQEIPLTIVTGNKTYSKISVLQTGYYILYSKPTALSPPITWERLWYSSSAIAQCMKRCLGLKLVWVKKKFIILIRQKVLKNQKFQCKMYPALISDNRQKYF